jgi:uncharacterized protein (TIGR00730 family)
MKICVFCASSPGADPHYAEAARDLGVLFARRSIGLVYGGGNVGLMGIIADAVLAAGGEVIGVIPEALVAREVAHRGVDLRVVASMHERKQLMHALSDGFITLPGGFGTLDELFETLTWGQLGMHRKPIGLLDVGGYFRPLLTFLDGAVQNALLRLEHRTLLIDDMDANQLLDRMASFVPPDLPKWIGTKQT